ncbi:hypothetical protein QBC42DRAFT_281338 [Cladorrhinum samala]|uniref:Uncharacterized protein n=1 Tax=Cladorrhinum samala TaxID=585594 RepID=A0AAV9H6T3_9PEZI|nr:hypothetical protein QBC42DRAFT_281338 [Cladorrhinum samala]
MAGRVLVLFWEMILWDYGWDGESVKQKRHWFMIFFFLFPSVHPEVYLASLLYTPFFQNFTLEIYKEYFYYLVCLVFGFWRFEGTGNGI